MVIMPEESSNKEYLLLTDYFHPESVSTGRLMTELAVGLRERGLDLTVYTSQPSNHGETSEKVPRHTTHKGVPVKRVRSPQIQRTSKIRHLAEWILFPIVVFCTLVMDRPSGDRELIVVSNPPLLPLFAWALCRLRGWEMTYIIHDLWPDIGVNFGYYSESGMLNRVWSAVHRAVVRDSANLIVLGPAMKEYVREQVCPSITDEQITVIHNWEDQESIRPISKHENWFSEQHGLRDQFTVVYSGNINDSHDLETVVNAAEHLDEDVHVLIIGEGLKKDELISLAKQSNVCEDTVTFLPYQPVETLPYSLTCGDVTLVTKTENVGLAVSCKVYTSLATGQPVLCLAEAHSDEARIVQRANAGIQVSPGDIDGVINAIERWRRNPDLVSEQGQNARHEFETRYTKRDAIDQYYDVLTSTESSNTVDPSVQESGRSLGKRWSPFDR